MVEKLRGVVPPMITSFDESGNLNEKAIRSVVRFETEYVHGLFICGSYGGGPLMNVEEKKQVVDIVTSEVQGQREVVVNISATNTRDAIELATYAAKAGANRVASVPPYYYHQSEENVLRYFDAIIKSVDIPVYVYNNPKTVGYGVSISTLGKLKELGLFGVKDSTFDLMWYDEAHRKYPDMDMVMGTEGLVLPAVLLGCQAFIPGLGNAFPDLLRKFFDQLMAKQYDAAYETHKLVLELRSMMSITGPTLVGVTEMAWLRGIDAGYPRSPFKRAEKEKVALLREAMVKVGALEA